MARVVISFLGGVSRDPNRSYHKTRYLFPDGTEITESYFGFALTNYLCAKYRTPDRTLILGTSGSMWDIFAERLQDTAMNLDLYATIGDKAREGAVTQEDTNKLAKALGNSLSSSREWRFLVIPYSLMLTEQFAILRTFTEHVAAGDEIVLDVTHGLRHLPMLALMSAIVLEALKKATVAGIYYGAWEAGARDRPATVVDLLGLLRLASWASALRALEETGDLSAFGPLLRAEGFSDKVLKSFQRAAFQERAVRLDEVPRSFRAFAKAAEAALSEPPSSRSGAQFFLPSIIERMRWTGSESRYGRQRDVAEFHLEHGDYLRAATFGYEAFVTRLVGRYRNRLTASSNNVDSADENIRKAAVDVYEADRTYRDEHNSFYRLRRLRNALAHGCKPYGRDVAHALESEVVLRQIMTKWFRELLPEETQSA
jgi:CRISPR-associated Csx2 family protein